MLHGECPNLIVGLADTHHAVRGEGIPGGTGRDRGDGDIGADGGKVFGVFLHQIVHVIHIYFPGRAAGLNRDLNEVGTQFIEGVAHQLLHTVTQRDDDDDGGHTDDDAQHGEKSPHLAGSQRFQGQEKGLFHTHQASTSSSRSSSSSILGWTTAWGSLESPS